MVKLANGDSASSSFRADDALEDASTLPEVRPDGTVDIQRKSVWSATRITLAEPIDADQAAWPLAAFCFDTGFASAVVYTATKIWPAFMSGATIQLSIALARTFSGRYAPTSGLGLMDGMALAALLSFIVGAAFLQIGVRLTVVDTRGWHIFASLVCALLTLIASILQIHPGAHGQGNEADNNSPAWKGARGIATVGLIAASMGLQGAIAKRLNTNFATSVVLTSVWIDLMSNPNLFEPRRIRSRDQRIYAIFSLFLGGFAARAILGGIASAATLGIGSGLRLLTAIIWWWVPAKTVR